MMDRKTKRLFWQLRVALLQAGEPWADVRNMDAHEMARRAQEIADERKAACFGGYCLRQHCPASRSSRRRRQVESADAPPTQSKEPKDES